MSEDTDNTGEAGSAEAVVGQGPRFSPIWFVPIVAVLIGLWMVYAHWASQGPLIEIRFNSGEGIEAGNTKIKRRNVEIGEVLKLQLSEDAEHVILSVRMDQQTEDLLRADTKFWVVRPRVARGGISGLSTLLSGSYIEMSLGTSEESARDFVGLEAPPVTAIGTPGLHITLDSDGDRALDEGDPVLFHGMQVGTIEYVHFNTQERRTYYNTFIAAPYDRLITTNTQFWFSNGVSVELSADGVRVDVATLTTLIAGGVSFDVPDGQPPGERITERAFFTIHPRESAIYEKYYEHMLRYVILFDDSIRGLRPGAPVEYRGVKVGEVLRTDIEYEEVDNVLDATAKIPVMIELVPARFGFEDTEVAVRDAETQINQIITSGLHGALATGNLMTGQKLVELQYFEHEPHPEETFAGVTVIPSVSGQVGRLIDSAASAIDKINKLPMSDVTTSAGKALEQAATTLAQLDTVLEDVDIREVMERLNDTFLRFQELAEDFSAGSETHENLQKSLRSLEQSLNELEPLLRNLRRKPNSLIFSGPDTEDPEPKGARE